MATNEGTRGSIATGTIWMMVLLLLLFWIPVVGPFIAGFVGGRKSGGVVAGLISSLIPAGAAAGLLFLVGTLFGLPVIGAVVGAGIFIVILVESVPLTLGGIVGGATAS